MYCLNLSLLPLLLLSALFSTTSSAECSKESAKACRSPYECYKQDFGNKFCPCYDEYIECLNGINCDVQPAITFCRSVLLNSTMMKQLNGCMGKHCILNDGGKRPSPLLSIVISFSFCFLSMASIVFHLV